MTQETSHFQICFAFTEVSGSECVRQKLTDRSSEHLRSVGNEAVAHSSIAGELTESLPTPATRDPGAVAIGDHDHRLDPPPTQCHHRRDRARLGARAKRVGSVFDIGRSDDPDVGAQRRTDPISRVRTVRLGVNPSGRGDELVGRCGHVGNDPTFGDRQASCCTTMQLYLRDALPADIDGLLALLSGGRLVEGDDSPINLPADMASFVDAIREIDRTDGTYLMVADLGGRLVGMRQLITFRHLQHRGGRCAEIESMHVASDMRGQGVGGRLLDHAVRRGAQQEGRAGAVGHAVRRWPQQAPNHRQPG